MIGALSFWFLSRPFTFSENDGQLYAFMALARLDPHRFGGDLFIRFGSQDAFSIFSPIYGALIRLVGLTAATMALLILGAALWLAGCWRLARSVLEANRAAVVVIIFCVLHITYGGFSALYVSEALLTSRIFAEAFVLLGLAELARGAGLRAALLLILAAALHPIMALGGLATAAVWESFRRPWLLAVGAAALLAAAALALTGLPPFDRLLAVMDGPWLAAVEHRDGFVFLANWIAGDWANVFAQASVVLAAALISHGPRRWFFLSILIIAAGALAASAIGGDLLHSVLIIQLQLWRATWLLAWAGVVALFVLASDARRLAEWVVPALFAVALIFAQQVWLLDALAVIGLLGVVRGYVLPAWAAHTLIALCALIFAGFVVSQVELAISTFAWARHLGLTPWSYKQIRWAIALTVAPLFVLALFRRPAALPLFAGVLLVLSAATWDQRNAWQKLIMNGGVSVSAPSPVLWSEDVAPTWFLLRAPSWLSLQQASGLLFSRQTALTWAARAPTTRGIVRPTVWRPAEPPLTCAQVDPVVTVGDLRSICANPDHPGAIILDRATAGAPSADFTTPVDRVSICRTATSLEARRSHVFYVYRCGA